MFLLVLLPLAVGASDGGARDVVRHALRAVEGDSVTVVAARWRQAVTSNPNDRLAALGLATIASLTYRWAEADSAYAALMPPGVVASAARQPAPKRDEVATYA